MTTMRATAPLLLGLGLLMTAGCGVFADEELESEAPAAEAEEEQREDETQQDPQHAGPMLEIEAVSVGIPDGWAVQDTPEDYNPSAWAAGAFDDEEFPAEFIRVIPSLDEESASSDLGASRLVAEAEIAESYGENFETTDRRAGEIAGAEDVHVVDFRYFEDEVEILGRWWVMADQSSEVLSAVEHAGRADVAPDFDSTADRITFEPGATGT